MAKKPGKKTTRKTPKTAVRKSPTAGGKVGSSRKAAKKSTTGRTTSKKKSTARKPASRAGAAKPKVRTAAKKSAKRATKKTVRKTAGKAVAKAADKSVKKAVPRVTSAGSTRSRLTDARSSSNGPMKRSLSKSDLVQFRDLLLAKRAQLVGDVFTLQAEALSKNRQDAAGDLSSMPIHMADLGTDNYEKEFTLGLIEGERALLRDIDEALVRIENGTYGVCEATGKPIGKARLRARPWAKFCYEYVLAQEKGRQSGGL